MKIGAFWYEDKNNFLNRSQADSCLKNRRRNRRLYRETFIAHFKSKYDGRPPSWMTIEICPFGLVSKLAQNLRDYSIRNTISAAFGVSPSRRPLFEGWIISLVYVRNICAHHSRLWNRTLTLKPGVLERGGTNPWIYTDGHR